MPSISKSISNHLHTKLCTRSIYLGGCFGGVACFCCFFFVCVVFVTFAVVVGVMLFLIFEMIGPCQSFGCVRVFFVTVVVVVGIWLYLIFKMTGNCRSFGGVGVFFEVVGILLFLIFEMTGLCGSFGCVPVFFVTAVRVVVICSRRRSLSSLRTRALSTLSSSRFSLSTALSSSHARALSTLSSSRCSLSASNAAVSCSKSATSRNSFFFAVGLGFYWLRWCSWSLEGGGDARDVSLVR